MMMIAKNFLQTDVVVIGIIIIGAIGFAIEMLMRVLEGWLIPWKGRADGLQSGGRRGRLAQRESTVFTRQGSVVQIHHRPPTPPAGT